MNDAPSESPLSELPSAAESDRFRVLIVEDDRSQAMFAEAAEGLAPAIGWEEFAALPAPAATLPKANGEVMIEVTATNPVGTSAPTRRTRTC